MPESYCFYRQGSEALPNSQVVATKLVHLPPAAHPVELAFNRSGACEPTLKSPLSKGGRAFLEWHQHFIECCTDILRGELYLPSPKSILL